MSRTNGPCTNWSGCNTRAFGTRLSEISELEKPDLMEITVYSVPWCPDCREAKLFLDQHKLPYTDVDIEATPGAAEEVLKRTGKHAVPQFVIDGEWVQPYRPDEGFLYEEMARRLGVEQ
jgi:mycoredoxin